MKIFLFSLKWSKVSASASIRPSPVNPTAWARMSPRRAALLLTAARLHPAPNDPATLSTRGECTTTSRRRMGPRESDPTCHPTAPPLVSAAAAISRPLSSPKGQAGSRPIARFPLPRIIRFGPPRLARPIRFGRQGDRSRR